MSESKQFVPEKFMETKTDAIEVLDDLTIKIYSKLKGRILADIEMVLPAEDSRLIPLKNSVNSHILFVTKYMKDKISQAIKILQDDK